MNLLKLFIISFFIFIAQNHLYARESSPPSKDSFEKWENRPKENFTHAKENFLKVKELLLKNYHDSSLSEEQLYFAATQGMINHLNKNSHQWNKLISPTELQEMQIDLKGQLSGIGIIFKLTFLPVLPRMA